MAAEFLRLQSDVCVYEVESNSFESKQGIIPDQIRPDQNIYKSPVRESRHIHTAAVSRTSFSPNTAARTCSTATSSSTNSCKTTMFVRTWFKLAVRSLLSFLSPLRSPRKLIFCMRTSVVDGASGGGGWNIERCGIGVPDCDAASGVEAAPPGLSAPGRPGAGETAKL